MNYLLILLYVILVACSESSFQGSNSGNSKDKKSESDGSDDDSAAQSDKPKSNSDGGDNDDEADGANNGDSKGDSDGNSGSDSDGDSAADSQDDDLGTDVDLGKDTDNSDGDIIIEDGEISRKRCGSDAEKSKEFVLQYSSTAGQDCAWGVGINQSYQTGTDLIRALREQTQTLEIPDGAVICDFEMKMREASVRYDDYMFVVLAGYLVASSSYPRSEVLGTGMKETDSGLIEFEPELTISKLPTTVAVNNRENQYCASDAVCDIPKSDTASTMTLDFGFEFFEKLPEEIRFQNSFGLSIYISGQGDSKRQDCEHTGMTFDGTIRFIEN